jgi:hypothetical protein
MEEDRNCRDERRKMVEMSVSLPCRDDEPLAPKLLPCNCDCDEGRDERRDAPCNWR